MIKSVVEGHPQLYHYTTAAGLKGIVETQQLRATSISYLNDAEEHVGFFDRRLPYLLEEPIRTAMAEVASKKSDRSQMICDFGGTEKAVDEYKTGILTSIRSVTLAFNNPYVTSFCSALPNEPPNDGILSQWRGYGSDGGYAIVFETAGLQDLLTEEEKLFHYQFFMWCDVEYYNQNNGEKAAHPETLEYERTIRETIHKAVTTGNRDAFESLLEPITALSFSHKHRGFQEEAEVRIVVVPSNDDLFEATKEQDKRPRKPVGFWEKNGVLIPHIMLFGQQSTGKLPISKVIVGPHPDRLKRKKATELLLEQHGIDATVMVSDIPYLGR